MCGFVTFSFESQILMECFKRERKSKARKHYNNGIQLNGIEKLLTKKTIHNRIPNANILHNTLLCEQMFELVVGAHEK